MKNIFFILYFLLSLSSCSQTSEKKTNKQGLLWKISGNGLQQSSYLFGTHHYTSGKYLCKIQGFIEAFDSVQQIIVEIDSLNLIESQNIRNYYKTEKFLPTNVKYSTLLNERDYSVLDSITVKHWNIHADKVPLKPNALYEELDKEVRKDNQLENLFKKHIPDSLLMYTIGIKAGLDSNNWPMDFYISKKAKNTGYKIIGLESIEYSTRLALSPSIDIKNEAKSTVYRLINQDKISEAIALAYSAYLQQNLELWQKKTELIAKLSFSDGIDLYDVKERNQNWIPIIKSAIAQEASMIAVGVGHLSGKYGLIELLRQEGYTVEEFK